MLAAKLLLAQGLEVIGVCFESNFYSCAKAKIAAEQIGIELKVVDISKEMLDLVKNPPTGYGKHLNPCLDCHGLMVKSVFAKATTDKDGAIVATGEVLGQRPFSQTRPSLKKVEKLAGCEILRPLSAKLLPETEAEKKGLVNRGRLLNIKGRNRERQMELAKKFKIKEYPNPAGGCLLTDQKFSERLMKMLDYWPECTPSDVELLKWGRVFWVTLKALKDSKRSQKVLIVVGRNKEECEKLEKLAKIGDVVMELRDIKGPLTVVRFSIADFRLPIDKLKLDISKELKMGELKLGEKKNEKEILEIAGLLIGWYAVKARGKKVSLDFRLPIDN